MTQYYFIFGNHPELAKAELKNKLSAMNTAYEILGGKNNYLILQSNNLLPEKLLSQLGGTIKVGEVLKKDSRINPNAILHYATSSQTEKLHFGISSYGFHPNLNKWGAEIKKELKQHQRRVRFVTSKQNPLSSVIVKKEILNKDGLEFCILKQGDDYWLGKTLAVQDFATYSVFDYSRPRRDELVGMLPPKLAQIMINLSEAKPEHKILDPFCGMGTILQQASLMNFEDLFGTDKSQDSLDAAEENRQWLEEKLKRELDWHLQKTDARDLDKLFKSNEFDRIISEPYMGPALKQNTSVQEIQKNIQKLTGLYQESLNACAKILKPEGIMVFIIPSFVLKKEAYAINFKKILPPKLKLKKSWLYARSGQLVKRNILLLIKT